MESTSSNHDDNSWSIGTYLRIRPTADDEVNEIETHIEDREVEPGGPTRSILHLVIPPDADPGLVHNNSLTGKLRFEFDHVFDSSASQEHVFDLIARDNVLAVLDGVSGTVFAYGQTGSGKTYSIFGGSNFQERGLIPRSLTMLFEQLKLRKKRQKSYIYKCQISFTEIYKETVYDLLDPERRDQPLESWDPVQLMEGEEGLVLRNLNVYEAETEEEALQLFFMGHSARITSSTAMNNASSRSHAVFTILLESEGIKADQTLFTCGKINMVDLAGSERMYKLENTQRAIKEAKSINLSLHFLEQVIITLREQAQQQIDVQAKHGSKPSAARSTRHGYVPYRNSVLTSLLRDSLGGNCRSSFLLTVNPDRQHFEETVATCRFGQRCGEVKLQISANTEVGLSDQLKELTARVKALERQLASLEEEKLNLSLELQQERELRLLQTEPRTLSAEEKTTCKTSVQGLLAAAKESILLNAAAAASNRRSNMSSNELGKGTSTGAVEGGDAADEGGDRDAAAAQEEEEEGKESAEEIIERSHDELFDTVEQMDKAVLVELSTALGSLVQSMYIEREVLKQQQAAAEMQHEKAAKEAQQKLEEEQKNMEIVRRGDSNKLSSIQALPLEMQQMVIKGALFVKHSRMGKKEVRFFHTNELLTHICWKAVGVKKKKVADQGSSALLSNFESVEHDDSEGNSCRILFKGRAGQKNILLEYAEGESLLENQKVAKEWAGATKFLVQQARKSSH